MARSHHRKGHKQHLQQFKHRGDSGAGKAASKGSSVFAVGGAVFGLAIGYMASGNIFWVIAGLVLGGTAGYFIGKKIDEGKKDDSSLLK